MASQHDGRPSSTLNETRLSHVPAHLRIQVLYKDESVVVIDKPCNLRSVPGHATSSPPRASKRARVSSNESHRTTAQEAWTCAIRSFQDMAEVEDSADLWLRNLALTPNLSSVPRKWKPFQRYCQRNQQRLKTDEQNESDSDEESKRADEMELDSIARTMHERIEQRQRPLLNLPDATDHEESAYGQLILLGYSGTDTKESLSSSSSRKLFVVHRLDCEVSHLFGRLWLTSELHFLSP